jgi:hypothetical protein
MLALHGGVLGLALLGLTKRHNQWSWRDLRSKHPGAPAEVKS